MKPQNVKPSPSSVATASTTQGGEYLGGDGGWPFSGSGLLSTLVFVAISAIVVPAIYARVVTAKLKVSRRIPRSEHQTLSIVAESHLSTSKGDRALLRERLRAMNKSHPELRDLTAAKHAFCEEGEVKEEEGAREEKEEQGEREEEGEDKEEGEEEEEEVDELQKEVAEALSESRRLARENLQATRTSANDLRNTLRSMREKLAAADKAEGKSDMKQEFLEEMEALAEADIGPAILCDDRSVGMVELHALMANRFRDQCEHANREAKKVAAILLSKPDEDLAERSAEQLMAAIEAEREEEGRTLQALVRQATEDIAAAKNRVHGYEKRYAAAERSIRDEQKREVEEKKNRDTVLRELREFVNRAPALLQDIGEARRAVAAARKKKSELVLRERELKEELDKP